MHFNRAVVLEMFTDTFTNKFGSHVDASLWITCIIFFIYSLSASFCRNVVQQLQPFVFAMNLTSKSTFRSFYKRRQISAARVRFHVLLCRHFSKHMSTEQVGGGTGTRSYSGTAEDDNLFSFFQLFFPFGCSARSARIRAAVRPNFWSKFEWTWYRGFESGKSLA